MLDEFMISTGMVIWAGESSPELLDADELFVEPRGIRRTAVVVVVVVFVVELFRLTIGAAGEAFVAALKSWTISVVLTILKDFFVSM